MQITQENLFSYMQAWLRECDMKILGYHNDTKAQKTKKCFCDSLHLLEFLDTFSYDLVYNSKEFFLAVAKQSQRDLGVNQCEFETLLQDSISRLENLRILREARINFKTQYRIRWHTANPLIPEPQYAQATLNLAEILQIAKEVVLKHYTKYNGRLSIGGDILEYYVFYNGTRYEFDTQGNLKDNPQAQFAQGVISVTLSV
ncbi:MULTISPECIES: hypothetical protein [Helicobacter]|uniref:Uncharacterized protein n=1 Tax=Helicobacter bilis ATCC 43879 TaxID=613026 RepID=C3XII9_9HELI|nr:MULTISPECIES: hypothetical protein [Helicobacter]EEO24807.1 hypothetical protein HRAG_01864 [Helicobacter bilis ATCC 43879]